MKGLIKFIIIILLVIGIGLVIRNVVLKSKNTDDTFINNKNNGKYYQVTVSLLDKDTDKFISDSELSVETEDGKIIEKWTTKNEAYVINNVPKGKYILKQVSASDGYNYNEDATVFTVTDKNLKIVMYNTPSKDSNTGDNSGNNSSNNGSNNSGSNNVSENIGVVDTLSIKNPVATIFGGIITIAGIMLLVFNKKIFAKDEA